jgi:hypothetical protein
MAESKISEIVLVKSKEDYSSDENIEINVQLELRHFHHGKNTILLSLEVLKIVLTK